MNEEIKTALIGAGNMGKNHARVLSEIPHTRLVAISDINPNIGAPLAEKYNAAYYQDYLTMLDEQEIDALSVVVPTHLHREVVLASLGLGIPTLVEKPIAGTVEDAEAMILAMQENNTLLMVGHIERFNPAVICLKGLIDEGKLGRIINLNSRRVGLTPPPTKNSDVALDLGIHDVDVFNYLLDAFPTESTVYRQQIYNNNIADAASIMLRYPSAVGMIETNWTTDGDKVRNLYVTGTHGTAALDYINQRVVLRNQRVLANSGDFLNFVRLSERPNQEEHSFSYEPLKIELQEFLRLAQSQKTCALTFSALEALKALV